MVEHREMEKALLDTEMTVVRNEFEMGENSPERILMQRVLEAAYTWHNYGQHADRQPQPISRTCRSNGWRRSIRSITSPITRC